MAVYVVDAKRESVYVDGHEVRFTNSQWEILLLLWAGGVVKREDIINATTLSVTSVKESIYRIRRRLGSNDCIRAYHGGYLWEGELR